MIHKNNKIINNICDNFIFYKNHCCESIKLSTRTCLENVWNMEKKTQGLNRIAFVECNVRSTACICHVLLHPFRPHQPFHAGKLS